MLLLISEINPKSRRIGAPSDFFEDTTDATTKKRAKKWKRCRQIEPKNGILFFLTVACKPYFCKNHYVTQGASGVQDFLALDEKYIIMHKYYTLQIVLQHDFFSCLGIKMGKSLFSTSFSYTRRVSSYAFFNELVQMLMSEQFDSQCLHEDGSLAPKFLGHASH